LADANFKCAGFNGPVHVFIQQGQIIGVQGKGYRFLFAGIKGYTFKAAQVAIISGYAAYLVFQVKFNHIIAFAGAGVGYINRYGNIALVRLL
jgi:hypothetical protein